MANHSFTEENYLKVLYSLTLGGQTVGVGEIASALDIKAPTVTDMMKKLAAKGLVQYTPYKALELTPKGRDAALMVVRRHRLWELFLVEVLGFRWDEVHDVAEELEHVQSEQLIAAIDRVLQYPRFDPHGDPIPDRDGRLPEVTAIPLTHAGAGKRYTIQGVSNHTTAFLQYLDRHHLAIGETITVTYVEPFDQSVTIATIAGQQVVLSGEAARHVWVG